MIWRQWLYRVLTESPDVTAIVPAASIYGSGSLGSRPESKPFIIIRMNPTQTDRFWHTGNSSIWVHDEPGDYGRIDAAIEACRWALDRAILREPGAITVEWTGDSDDLADDGYGTIVKNSSYRLVSIKEQTA